MKARVLFLLLIAALGLSFVSGCGRSSDQTGALSSAETSLPSGEPETSAPEKENVSCQTQTVFSLGDAIAYCPNGSLLRLGDDRQASTFTQLKTVEESTEEVPFDSSLTQYCVTDQQLILPQIDEMLACVKSYDFSDRTSVKGKDYFTGKAFREAADALGFHGEADGDYDALCLSMQNIIDGGDGFLYFTIGYNGNEIDLQAPLLYRVGKYSVSEEKVTFLTDVFASSFLVLNGTVYYYDNGVVCNSSNVLSVDKSRVGLYSVRTDGSGKKLLTNNFDGNPEAVLKNGADLCVNISIVGNQLYYINAGSADNSSLYQINLDGSDCRRVTEDPCCSYYLADGKLYYLRGSYLPTVSSRYHLSDYSLSDGFREELHPYTMVERSLDSGEEKELFVKNHPYGVFSVKDGCLYFRNDLEYYRTYQMDKDFVESEQEAPDLSRYDLSAEAPFGQRYLLSEHKMENLYALVLENYPHNDNPFIVGMPADYAGKGPFYLWRDAPDLSDGKTIPLYY